MPDDFLKHVDALRAEASYRNYLRVRDNALNAMREGLEEGGSPSNYWQEELAGFDYMLDASPLIIRKLREHCYHITGVKSYDYRGHHGHAAPQFAEKLSALRALGESKLFVPESSAMGGFGHEIDGDLINIDTLKFFESLIAMRKGGLLNDAGQQPARKVWLEIGAGWGGFAYAAKTLFPRCTYVIVDLPQTFLFSSTYLMSVFQGAKCALYPESSLDEITSALDTLDFIFLPHYLYDRISFKIDLAINMISFQEMTTEQVRRYVKGLERLGCRTLYSHNRDRSRHNPELSTVSAIIGESFAETREIRVLDYGYTSLVPRAKKLGLKSDVAAEEEEPAKLGWRSLFRTSTTVKAAVRADEQDVSKRKKEKPRKVEEYRHLIASR